jgi:predicted homoserine dehydrogenase-like protein
MSIQTPITGPNVALNGLARDLAARVAEGKPPIRIGLVGSGEMGTDIVTAVRHMPGVEVAAIAEVRRGNAVRAVMTAGHDEGAVIEAETAAALDRGIEAGKIVVTHDAGAICTSERIDVVIDATGKPAVGAEIGLRAMEHGKHLVMMNVEADVTIGAYLKREADRLGVVYTLGAGDEPSSCMELINFVSAMGYPIVSAGKGKNNPLNIDATPDAYMDEAKRRNMNPRMLVEFVDGSKTMVEMAAIANATGLVPDVPGMHGPACSRDELSKVLVPKEDGGVLTRKGVVDYSIGKGVAPGVFVVAEMSHPRVRERMHDLKLGPGPYYMFFRPYHLTSLEVPLSAARAALYRQADMQPMPRPVAEVCAVAKRDLAAGEALDAIGEYTYRAFVMTVGEAKAKSAIPCGLIEGGKTLAPIKRGELITYANAAPDPVSRIVELRRRQDAMLAG